MSDTKQRIQPLFFDAKGLDLEQLESFGSEFARWQKGVLWWIGDCARYAEARYPDTWHQAFPADVSPGLVDRCKAVAKAYPTPESRNPLASWSTMMRHANRPDRIQRVQEAVEAGRTSDEDREATKEERADNNRPRWMLAVDVHYFLHRFWFSGAGVEAAVGVSQWVQRTSERLREKGLTDVICCFDSYTNARKQLTEGWENEYKGKRVEKDPELGQQLRLVRELLEGAGFCCASVDGQEGDDIMASCAQQFPGKVTLLSQDKDLRQCLSDKCNILLDVVWTEDETSGDMMPEYKWLSSAAHTEATGIRPDQWCEYQAVAGDTVDNIKGAVGIGAKVATDLIKEFGTVEAAIEAAKADDERIKPAKRKALIEFEPQLDVTRQLVTLHTDIPIPENTRI